MIDEFIRDFSWFLLGMTNQFEFLFCAFFGSGFSEGMTRMSTRRKLTTALTKGLWRGKWKSPNHDQFVCQTTGLGGIDLVADLTALICRCLVRLGKKNTMDGAGRGRRRMSWWDRDVANIGSEGASEIGDSRISPAVISLSQAQKSFSNFMSSLIEQI